MSTNLIDKMTEAEAKSLLNEISAAFSIGGAARTPEVILERVVSSAAGSEVSKAKIEALKNQSLEYQAAELNTSWVVNHYVASMQAFVLSVHRDEDMSIEWITSVLAGPGLLPNMGTELSTKEWFNKQTEGRPLGIEGCKQLLRGDQENNSNSKAVH